MHDSKRKNWQESKRIRKLLASEYYEFSETILVESSFAETSRNGRGIRQVSLGLTLSSLIVAGDILRRSTVFFCPRDLDPSIETFELISIYPLQYVSLTIFKRRRQKTLKARFIDGRVKYYEFGGTRQTRCWRIWCEQVEKLRSRKMEGSSLSESTAASSSSTSTLYFHSSDVEFRRAKGRKSRRTMLRIWKHYGCPGDIPPRTWTQKHLYLGPSYEELFKGQYSPVPMKCCDADLQEIRNELTNYSSSNTSDTKAFRNRAIYEAPTTSPSHCLCNVHFHKGLEHNNCEYCAFPHALPTLMLNRIADYSDTPIDKKTLTRKVSRFGVGVTEKCNSSLVLGPCRRDFSYRDILRSQTADDFYTSIESAVSLWESKAKNREKTLGKRRHLRRYAIAAAAHFHRALGPWSIQPGERNCIENHRSMSVVTIRKQPVDLELRLPVSRRQLTTSASCTSLQPDSPIGPNARGKVILFWTPDYWYRPRHAIDAYRQLRRHLDHLREFQQQKEQQQGKRKFFNGRRKSSRIETKESDTVIVEKSSSLLGRIFAGSSRNGKGRKDECEENDATAHLKRLLRMDLRITIWDLDSTVLATQLTLIDRDLFTRIPAEEIRVLAHRRTCASAPNLGAWIAFAHRVSCLTTSEVLSIRNLQMRARIMARLINAANKCFIMGNFQSCRSILAGLQAPPIYRLKTSWSYLRIHHATRYEMMERHCKVFKSSSSKTYRKTWRRAERNPPYLPYVGDLLMRISESPDINEPTEYSDDQSYEIEIKREESQSRIEPAICPPSKNSCSYNRSFGKRLLAMTLIPFRLKSKVTSDNKKEDLKLIKEDLARKYFHRWKNSVLISRIKARRKERLRTMDFKTKQILDVASWLIECQRVSQSYDFPLHSIAQEFLLKARYREDRENFFISLKLESSKVT